MSETPAPRGTGSLRSFQRKLQIFITDLLKLDAIAEVVNALEDSPEHQIQEAQFLLDKDATIQYEDASTFHTTAMKAFRHIGKLRGLRKHAAEALNEFENLWEKHFQQSLETSSNVTVDGTTPISISSRKRSQHDNDVTHQLTSEEKSAIGHIITAIMKDEDIQDFTHPVNTRAFPEYYEHIKHPMDLSTVKRKINKNEYSSVEECLHDLRLIWSNCKAFNDPSSDIYKTADRLASMMEEEVEERLGSEYCVRKKKARKPSTEPSNAPASVKSEDHVESLLTGGEKSSLKALINTISKEDMVEEVFMYPVDAKAFPEYYEHIKHPMDLSTVKRKINKNEYSSVEECLHDLRLIWSNCKAFNDPSSDIYKTADRLASMMEEEIKVSFRVAKSKLSPNKENKDAKSVAQSSSGRSIEKNIDPSGSSSSSVRNQSSNSNIGTASTTKIVPPDAGVTSSKPTKPNTSVPSLSKSTGQMESNESTRQEILISSKENVKDGVLTTSTESNATSGEMNAASSSNRPVVSSLPETPEEIDRLEVSLTRATTAAQLSMIPSVRERAVLKSYELLRKTKLPYLVAPYLLQVINFGHISTEVSSHNHHYIFPVGYTCSHTFRINLVKNSANTMQIMPGAKTSVDTEGESVNATIGMKSPTLSAPYINVDLRSCIKIDEGVNKRIIFVITLENGTVVSTAYSARGAWEAVFGKELNVVHSLGSSLKRCHAVFNRISISPDANPFLERVPFDSPGANLYYSVITAPMWLREIHSRLIDGTYDNEFDFAWDMRLIFQNCMIFNEPSSDLYKSAQRMHLAFDHLFFAWVTNVQDKSITDSARGPWDDWMKLRYFDGNPEEHVCAISGVRVAPADSFNQMIQCKCCEDQFIPASLPPNERLALSHYHRFPPMDWCCRRCVEAINMASGDLRNEPFSSISSHSIQSFDMYNVEEFGGNSYLPAHDIGLGWGQARRKLKSGRKNVFLSPLGYEVNSREMIQSQMEYENSINKQLIDARAKEFKEDLPTAKKRRTRHNRRRRTKATAASRPSSSTDEPLETKDKIEFSNLEDDGRIPLGKLHSFVVPSDYQLAWFQLANRDQIYEKYAQYAANSENEELEKEMNQLLNNWQRLTAQELPHCGFYGLNIAAVKRRIEGLDINHTCKTYVFSDVMEIKAHLMDDVTKRKEFFDQAKDGEEALQTAIKNERYFFDNIRVHPHFLSTPSIQSMPCSAIAALPERERLASIEQDKMQNYLNRGFSPLFPPTMALHHGETLMCMWDFLDNIRPILGLNTPSISLVDMMSSVLHQGGMVPTFGQAMFDEICCMCTDVLLSDVRIRANIMEEAVWQNIILNRPVNVITWPHILLEVLRIVSFPLNTTEIISTLSTPIHGIRSLERDVLCLLFNHPLIDPFLLKSPVLSDMDEQTIAETNFFNTTAEKLLQMKQRYSGEVGEYGGDEDERSRFTSFCRTVKQIFVDVVAANFSDVQRNLFAEMIIDWLDEFFLRHNLPAEEEETSVKERINSSENIFLQTSRKEQLSKFSLRAWRFWGGRVLSNVDIPIHQLLTPWDFGNPFVCANEYQQKMVIFNALERVMWMLSNSDPESWTVDDRINLYIILMEYCSVTAKVVKLFKDRDELQNRKLERLTHAKEMQLISSVDSKVDALQEVKSSPTGYRCFFTGIPLDPTPAGITVVIVPTEFQTLPDGVTSNGATKYTSTLLSSSSSTDQTGEAESGGRRASIRVNSVKDSTKACITFKYALKKLILAREKSHLDAQEYEDKIVRTLLPTLFMNAKEVPLPIGDSTHLGFRRSQPLGYDRNGSAYWLLHSQQLQTIFNFRGDGTPQHTLRPPPQEPCLLVKDMKTGWWGYHNGHNLPSLINGFANDIPYERMLKLKIIERIAYSRSSLYKLTLNIRIFQKIWYDRRLEAECALVRQQIDNTMSVKDKTQFLEVMWARAYEIRQLLHYASLYNFDSDSQFKNTPKGEREALHKRQRRLMQLYYDDCLDFHCAKGWQRNDALLRIRQTSATTTCTRIHADPSLIPLLTLNLQRTVHLQRPQQQISPVQLNSSSTGDAVTDGGNNDSNEGARMDIDGGENTVNAGTESSLQKAEGAVSNAVSGNVNAESLESRKKDIPVSDGSGRMEIDGGENTVNAGTESSLQKVEEAVSNAVSGNVNAESLESSKKDIPVSDGSGRMEIDGGENITRKCQVDEVGLGNKVSHASSGEDRKTENEQRVAHIMQISTASAPLLDMTEKVENTRGPGMKPVEQLHPITGAVLRVYRSGRDAAAFMNVSQPGISQCCSGSRREVYGFKWRIYKGPPIDWQAIEPHQAPLHVLRRMQTLRGKSVLMGDGNTMVGQKREAVDDDYESKQQQTLTELLHANSAKGAIDGNEASAPQQQQQQSIPPQPQKSAVPVIIQPDPSRPHIEVSDVVVCARLLKLKAELLNIVFMIPEKSFTFPDLSDDEEATVKAAGEEAAQNVRNKYINEISSSVVVNDNNLGNGAPDSSAIVDQKSPSAPISSEEIERIAERTSRKVTRRMRRRLAMNHFLESVRSASSALEFLSSIMTLEKAIPMELQFLHRTEPLPLESRTFYADKTLSTVATMAVAAVRLYALDRRLMFDSMKDTATTAAILCPHQLRTVHAPRCMLSSQCTLFLCHQQKCNSNMSFIDGPSRFAGIGEKLIPRMGLPMSSYGKTTSSYGNSAARGYQSVYQHKPRMEDQTLAEFLERIEKNGSLIDIENIQPYIPMERECSDIQYV